MCIDTAFGLEMQCAHEYWPDNENLGAITIHKLMPDERNKYSNRKLVG